MENELLFSTIAVVAVALAGFSGLALTLSGDSSPRRSQRHRFDVLLGTSLGAVVCSLLPMCLYAAGLLADPWRPSSGVLGLGLVSGLALWNKRARAARAKHPGDVHGASFPLMFGLETASCVLQLLGVVGVLPGPGPLAFGLWILLIHGAIQFRRLLYEPMSHAP